MPLDPIVETLDGHEIRVNPANSKFYAIIAGERYEARTLPAVRTRIHAQREGVPAFYRDSYESHSRFTTHKTQPAMIIRVDEDRRYQGDVQLIGRSGKPYPSGAHLYVWDEQRIAQLRTLEEQLNALMDQRQRLFTDWPPFDKAAFEAAQAQAQPQEA